MDSQWRTSPSGSFVAESVTLGLSRGDLYGRVS